MARKLINFRAGLKEPKKLFLYMQIFFIFGMEITKYDPKLRNSEEILRPQKGLFLRNFEGSMLREFLIKKDDRFVRLSL